MLPGICVLRDNPSRDGRTILDGGSGRGSRDVICKVVSFLLYAVFNVMG